MRIARGARGGTRIETEGSSGAPSLATVQPQSGGPAPARVPRRNPPRHPRKPCVRGLRITVYDVLDYLASGMTPEQIVDDFPDLDIEDIRACLAFAADVERRVTTSRS